MNVLLDINVVLDVIPEPGSLGRGGFPCLGCARRCQARRLDRGVLDSHDFLRCSPPE